MKRLLCMVALIAVIPTVSRAVSFDTSHYHTVVQADSGRFGVVSKWGYKDTVVFGRWDVSQYSKIFFQFQRHRETAALDSNFANDSVKVQVGFSYDGTNWTWKTLQDSAQVPMFATADSAFNITGASVNPVRRDSSTCNCGPIMTARIIVKDTSETWSAGLLGNSYGRKYSLHFYGIEK